MTKEEMRFTAALAIYQGMTAHMFGLRDQGKLPQAYSNVVGFATKYAVEQADGLIAELDKKK